MTIVNIGFEYSQKIQRALVERLYSICINTSREDDPDKLFAEWKEDFIEEGKEPESTHVNLKGWNHMTVCLEDMLEIGIPFKVIKVLRQSDSVSDIQRTVVEASRPEVVVNEKCHVAIAGLGTLQIRNVKLLEDCCTDRLQDHLDIGWRILACCVQPQRRPDYILASHAELDREGKPIIGGYDPFQRL